MKETVVLLSVLTALASCNTTTSLEDTQMLQSKYQIVYQVNTGNYITLDSAHVYHVNVTHDGKIRSTIKIK